MDISLTGAQQALIATILIPVIIAKIKQDIAIFFEDLTTYRNRRFDNDGDPGVGCECFLQNGTTGIFKKILVKDYTFHYIFASKREVITVQDAPEGEGVIIVPYTYAQWRDLIKGSLIKDREEVIREIKDPQSISA